jgi:membrane protease YdiL (CAAX protease family)
MALLVSVPSLVACAFVIAANGALRDQGLRRLGLARKQLRIGIVAGALGTVVAVPLVFAVVELTQWLWQAMRYAHPNEHELLTVIGKSPSTFLKWVFVVSAVVIAPVWEEVLFRGHVQTICAYGVDRLLRYARRSTAAAAVPTTPAPPQQGGDTPVLEYSAPVAPAPPAAPGVAERWGAIVVTSLLFAAVHEAWTAPPIFFLSLCLGYAYERTGSLWTAIVMHAAFNATSTILFLTLTR